MGGNLELRGAGRCGKHRKNHSSELNHLKGWPASQDYAHLELNKSSFQDALHVHQSRNGSSFLGTSAESVSESG